MSKAKDRARAKLGYIFRDGKLWDKELWYALHPTREMVVEQLASVKVAVGEEVNKKFRAELEAKFKDKPYLCSKCGHTHKPGSKVYADHKVGDR